MSRIQKGLFAHWSLQVFCGENCSVQGSPVPACRHCKLYLQCSGDRNHTPNTEVTVLFWGSSVPHWSLKQIPQYFYFLCWAFGDFFQRSLWGGMKISRKTTYVTPFFCLQWRLDLSFICRTGAAPVFRRCPGRSRLRIPPLFCRRSSPWRGYVFHTAGECGAADRSPCAAAWGGEHCSTSFLAF